MVSPQSPTWHGCVPWRRTWRAAWFAPLWPKQQSRPLICSSHGALASLQVIALASMDLEEKYFIIDFKLLKDLCLREGGRTAGHPYF